MKKKYKKPILQNLGNMRIMTQGATSRTNDPGGSQSGRS